MRSPRLFLFVFALFSGAALAQAPASQPPAQNDAGQGCCSPMEQHMKDLEERIIQLEGQVRMLQQQAQTSLAAAPGTTAPTTTQAAAAETAPGTAAGEAAGAPALAGEQGGSNLPVYGGSSAAAKALNPDISMIGD